VVGHLQCILHQIPVADSACARYYNAQPSQGLGTDAFSKSVVAESIEQAVDLLTTYWRSWRVKFSSLASRLLNQSRVKKFHPSFPFEPRLSQTSCSCVIRRKFSRILRGFLITVIGKRIYENPAASGSWRDDDMHRSFKFYTERCHYWFFRTYLDMCVLRLIKRSTQHRKVPVPSWGERAIVLCGRSLKRWYAHIFVACKHTLRSRNRDHHSSLSTVWWGFKIP